MTARIAVLTANPIDTIGDKIPDGFGMRISDSQTFKCASCRALVLGMGGVALHLRPWAAASADRPAIGRSLNQRPHTSRSYTAIFGYAPGTPCDVPLTATNRVRLVVNNPGDAPLPEAQTSLVTVAFTGCNTTASARFGQVEPFVNSTSTWSLAKKADKSALRLALGAAGNVTYRLTVTRAPPTVKYRVSGAVLVSPVGGVLGGPPLKISSVEVQLSSGDKGPAKCLPPNGDGSTACVFESIPYSLDTHAPLAGNATAKVRLADGGTLEAPPTLFDFMRVPTNDDAGARANLTDTLDADAIGSARAAGLRFIWDERLKPPSVREAPVVLTEGGVYEYSIKVRAGAKCGRHRLVNTAGLAPIGSNQKAMLARSEVSIDVVGCR
jgi:hypothetical protein